MKNEVSYVDQDQRRKDTLVTPITFFATAATDTVAYAGVPDQYFLIRSISVANTTGLAVNLTLKVGGNSWVTARTVMGNQTQSIEGVAGQMLADGDDLTVTGAGLLVFGWGLRIRGATEWTL